MADSSSLLPPCIAHLLFHSRLKSHLIYIYYAHQQVGTLSLAGFCLSVCPMPIAWKVLSYLKLCSYVAQEYMTLKDIFLKLLIWCAVFYCIRLMLMGMASFLWWNCRKLWKLWTSSFLDMKSASWFVNMTPMWKMADWTWSNSAKWVVSFSWWNLAEFVCMHFLVLLADGMICYRLSWTVVWMR